MARRRKKTSKNTRPKAGTQEKALPAIPPPEARKTAYIPDSQSSPFPDVYAEPPAAGVPSVGKSVSELQTDPDSRPSTSDQNSTRGKPSLPEPCIAHAFSDMLADMLTLPSTTFRNNRQSVMSQRSDLSGGGGEEFLIPLAFDPTPPVNQSPSLANHSSHKASEERPVDYFTSGLTAPATKSNTSSPHIAYQEKGRLPTKEVESQSRKGGSLSRSASTNASPHIPIEQTNKADISPRLSHVVRTSDAQQNDKFRLEAAPKAKKSSVPTPGMRSEGSTPRADVTANPLDYFTSSTTKPAMTPDIASPPGPGYSTPRMSVESSPSFSATNTSPIPTQLPTTSILQNLPQRGDSLNSAKQSQQIARKEVNPGANLSATVTGPLNGMPSTTRLPGDLAKTNGGKTISGPIGSSTSKSIFDAADNSSIQDIHSAAKPSQSFVDPRNPPMPPSEHSRSRNESFSTLQSDGPRYAESARSPALPRYSGGGDFNLEEDMARIMSGEEPNSAESFLRRVSNSVRHGRSYSDRTGRLSKDRWPRSPAVPGSFAAQEISSPSTASPEHRDELAWFKNELRRERQKTVEREKRIAELEMQLDSADIKQVNVELKEKRSTMVVLDTQKEIVIRELEVLTEHLAAAKHSGEPFDIGKMSNTVLRDFASALEKLRDSFAPQIEASIQKRNDLVDEIANLTQMKDKSFMEFEQLSSKNAQLAELNNQLVHQIQGLYKANSGAQEQQQQQQSQPSKSTVNGLGIYAHHKDKSTLSFESRDPMRNMSTDLTNLESASTLQGEAEPVTVIQGPQMVNIRSKKFDWRKGQKVAKGVTKGLKGAFTSTQQSYSRDLQFAETGAYGSNAAQGQDYSTMPKNNPEPVKQSGFGFFSSQKTAPKSNGLYAQQGNASTPSLLAEAGARKYFPVVGQVLLLTPIRIVRFRAGTTCRL
jgi:Rho-type GTPase-activating protein 1/2